VSVIINDMREAFRVLAAIPPHAHRLSSIWPAACGSDFYARGVNVRIVVIGDVGVIDGMIHIGDEAMFEELVGGMLRRGADRITAVSATPVETSSRYAIDAVANIGWPRDRAAALERMDLVARTAAGEAGLLADGDPAHAVIAAIAASDGVAVSGGGNLASTWPVHIYERGTIAAIAGMLGKPFVVSGQTIGPHLEPGDRELVRTMLSSARFVGLREAGSFELVTGLGVDPSLLDATVDDASYLGFDEPALERAPYCLVSLSGYTGVEARVDFVRATAVLLDAIAAETGLEVVFLAHFAALDAGLVRGDSMIHDEVRAVMASPSRVEPTTDSVAAARLSRSAALVVSSRYHPAVFAVSAGVPTIGIPVDDYTTTKLTGALGNFGQDTLVPAAALVAGEGAAMASAAWRDREATRARGLELSAAHRAASESWWDRVAATLAG
jgi:polysaccharide pyruvyl transferase WcaK-like protein